MLNGYKIKKYKTLVAVFFVLFIAHIPGADQEILKREVQKKSGSPSFIFTKLTKLSNRSGVSTPRPLPRPTTAFVGKNWYEVTV